LIRDPSKLVDINKFFAADVDLVNYLQNIKNLGDGETAHQNVKSLTDTIVFFALLCFSVILLTFIAYKMLV
jgi:hypothetical protein